MVVEQRFQMGRMAQRPRVSGGLPGRRRVGKGVIPAAGHRQAGGFRRRQQRLQKRRVVQVVPVAKGQPCRALRQSAADPGGPGGGNARVFLVQRQKSGVGGAAGVTHRAGTVGGAVIHQHADKIREGLGGDGIQTGR